MNKQNASSIASVTARQDHKKQLFGLSVDELALVTGGGGVIIEATVDIVRPATPSPLTALPAFQPHLPVAVVKP
jgi:hypothetical protein